MAIARRERGHVASPELVIRVRRAPHAFDLLVPGHLPLEAVLGRGAGEHRLLQRLGERAPEALEVGLAQGERVRRLAFEYLAEMHADASGRYYTGFTTSSNYPTTSGSYRPRNPLA